MISNGTLVLADGSVFEGELFGAIPPSGACSGEVVFNTVMSGYQEVISDPSYAGQIICFTTAHVGNYGVTELDNEASQVWARGVVVRDLARRHSNWRATHGLAEYLQCQGVCAIGGVDTRRLTRTIRTQGAIGAAFGALGVAELTDLAANAETTDGRDLVSTVTCAQPYEVDGDPKRHIVAIDCGIKATILSCLAEVGRVTVVPSSTSAAEILALHPDGVFLSNGPGDPSAVVGVVETLRALLDHSAIFGICMGNQLLATALGATTFKLPFGHHGGNHPVKDLTTGTIEITSQNHNYCVDLTGAQDVEVTHINLNDQTLEGFRSTRYDAFGIQYHPEAGPGPHDSRYLFERFAQLMDLHGAVVSS